MRQRTASVMLLLCTLAPSVAGNGARSVQSSERPPDTSTVYLSIFDDEGPWMNTAWVVNRGHRTAAIRVEMFGSGGIELGVAAVESVGSRMSVRLDVGRDIPSETRMLAITGPDSVDAFTIVRTRDAAAAEVLEAQRVPQTRLIFPLLSAERTACGSVEPHGEAASTTSLHLVNPNDRDAKATVVLSDSTGLELAYADLALLRSHETCQAALADLFDADARVRATVVRVDSDAPLVGHEVRRLASGDVAALGALAPARRVWSLPHLSGPLEPDSTVRVGLVNVGEVRATLCISDDASGVVGAPDDAAFALEPGELRLVRAPVLDAAADIHPGEFTVRSNVPVRAFVVLGNDAGCGLAGAAANPGAQSRRLIHVATSPDGAIVNAWSTIRQHGDRFISLSQAIDIDPRFVEQPAPPVDGTDDEEDDPVEKISGAVSDGTLQFRAPVDQITVNSACYLHGTCAGTGSEQHTAIDYGVGSSTTTPAFASNFGTLRQDIAYNQNTGCSSPSCNMGNSIGIEYLQTNGEKWMSLDAHLASKSISGIGNRVARGQRIGIVGCSGSAICSWGSNNRHAHHEHKKLNLGYLDLWPFGYMNQAEANLVQQGISITAAIDRVFRTVTQLQTANIRVLMPYFARSSAVPDSSNYEVYGVAGAPLYASITLRPETAKTFSYIGVGGRVWGNESAQRDVFLRPSETFGAGQSRALSGSATFVAGDYKFFPYIQRDQTGDIGTGYHMKVAVLPNANSKLVDNDGRTGYSANESNALVVPGYYVSAALFSGSSGNWAQWAPATTGTFEIWVHVPTGATATGVSYRVYTNGTSYLTTGAVNHSANNDRWVRLTAGTTQTWTLSSSGYVRLAVDGISASQFVGADAVKFIATGSGCTPSTSTIASGQSASGSLAATDCTTTAGNGAAGAYYDDFTFSGTSGQTVTVTLNAAFDTYLRLLNPTGTEVAFDDDSNGGTNSKIVYTLATSGTFTIRTTSYSPSATGSYTVALSGSGGGAGPSSPTNLSASAMSSSQINLSWTDNSSNESNFRIERKTGASGTWSEITTVGAGATSFSNTGLSASTTYYYRVRAYNSAGYSGYSNEPSATTQPGGCTSSTATIASGQSSSGSLATTDCTIAAGNGAAGAYYDNFTFSGTSGQTVTVTLNATFDTYLRLLNPSGTEVAFDDDSNGGTNSKIVYSLTTTGTFTIRTTSYLPSATGSYTVAFTSSSGGGGPTSPTNLSASAMSSSQINLSWTDNSSNESNFRIERKTGASGTWSEITTVGAGATSFSNTGLSASTTYYYRVRAYNSAGYSGYSNEPSATTQPGGCTSSTATIASGQSSSGSLATTDCTIAAGNGAAGAYYDNFTFSGTSGQTVTVTLNATFDTYLRLLNPSGTEVAFDDDSNGGTNSKIVYTLATTGTFTIRTTSYLPSATGSYTVALSAGALPEIAWHFNQSANFEGWACINIAAASVNSGKLFIDPLGADPYIISPTFSAGGSAYRYVQFSMASNLVDGLGKVYYQTTAEQYWSEDKAVAFQASYCALCGNASFYSYNVYMGSSPKWNAGTVMRIRIDPANNGASGTNTDSCAWDFVRVVP